jgi:HlyD family secretion protein
MFKKAASGFSLFILALFFGMLFINFRYYKGAGGTHLGIAMAKEYKVSSEKPGKTKHVYVVAGQEVKAGELLASFENRALEGEIIRLKNRIAAGKKEKAEQHSLLQYKISYLKAESSIQAGSIAAEIQKIKSEVDLNQRLTEQFIPGNTASGSTHEPNTHLSDPQFLEMRLLEEKKNLQTQAVSYKISELIKENAARQLALENEISLQARELELLLEEKSKLNKYATFDGIVSHVYVRQGEEAEAFMPIISILPRHPDSVVGYLVGTKNQEISVGEEVEIAAFHSKKNLIRGKVIGFGAITELPEILQKSTAVKSFGREVFIKIPGENPLANGEKVLVK